MRPICYGMRSHPDEPCGIALLPLYSKQVFPPPGDALLSSPDFSPRLPVYIKPAAVRI